MDIRYLWTAFRALKKLRGEKAWSWKRVAAPLWVPYCILGVVVAGMLTTARIKNGKW